MSFAFNRGAGFPLLGGTLWIQRHCQKIHPHQSLVPPHQTPPSKILSRGSKSPPIVDRPGGDGGGQPPNYYKISEH